MFSGRQLTEDFAALGVAAGDTVFLHASVRAVGEVAGGPDEIHLALMDALAAEGTILMYPSCPDYFDEVGGGNLSAELERELLEKLPPFDPLAMRSARDNGALVECFRTYPGTKVNAHVARFAARGRNAEFLVSSGQPWNYAYGHGSPLERFLELDGKILLLGSDHDAVTFLHYVEHVVDIPDKRVVRFQTPVMEDGRRVWRWMEEYDTSEGAHANWSERFFAELVDGYLAASGNRGGRVGNADSVLFRARELMDYAIPVMRRVAENGR